MNVNKESLEQRLRRAQLELLQNRVKKAEVTAETNKRLNAALSSIIDALQQDKTRLATERDAARERLVQANIILSRCRFELMHRHTNSVILAEVNAFLKMQGDHADADDEWAR